MGLCRWKHHEGDPDAQWRVCPLVLRGHSCSRRRHFVGRPPLYHRRQHSPTAILQSNSQEHTSWPSSSSLRASSSSLCAGGTRGTRAHTQTLLEARLPLVEPACTLARGASGSVALAAAAAARPRRVARLREMPGGQAALREPRVDAILCPRFDLRSIRRLQREVADGAASGVRSFTTRWAAAAVPGRSIIAEWLAHAASSVAHTASAGLRPMPPPLPTVRARPALPAAPLARASTSPRPACERVGGASSRAGRSWEATEAPWVRALIPDSQHKHVPADARPHSLLRRLATTTCATPTPRTLPPRDLRSSRASKSRRSREAPAT